MKITTINVEFTIQPSKTDYLSEDDLEKLNDQIIKMINYQGWKLGRSCLKNPRFHITPDI